MKTERHYVQRHSKLSESDVQNPGVYPQMTQMDADVKRNSYAQPVSKVSEIWLCCSAVRVGRGIGIPLAQRERYTGTVLHKGVQDVQNGD